MFGYKDPQWESMQQQLMDQYKAAQQAEDDLQRAKLETLQQVLSNIGNYRYLDFNELIDPDNKNWTHYTYKLPSSMISPNESEERQAIIDLDTPVGQFINRIRNSKNILDVSKQYALWNLYKPLDTPSSARDYVRYTDGYQGSNAPYGGSRPVFPTADESDPVKTTAGGTQGTQGVQGAKTGNAVAKSGTQGSNNGSGGVQGAQAGNGTYASAGVAKGGTKTIGYDPNPGNVSLAYAMRNAPEQERRTALINKWNQENGISYATGKDGLIYRTDPQHPNGYVDPFKNDLSKTGSTGYATGQGMLTSGSNGTYATGGGIKDANGNVLTNPGGDWEYQYALKNPQYGLGMMGKMSDAQKNYLQAVSNNMGYKYNFTGATRFV